MDTRNTGRNPCIERELDTLSLAPGSWGSTASGLPSDSEDWTILEHYPPTSFPGMPNHTYKPAVRYREFVNVTFPALFGKTDPLEAAAIELDKVHCDFAVCQKKFRYPSDLRFSIGFGFPLLFADVKKYKPVLDQLRRLDELRTRLARVPTYGNTQLRDKRAHISPAIESAIRAIEEHRLKLCEQAVEQALDDISVDLNAYVKQFNYPSELNFPPDSENGSNLANSERNQLLAKQLRKLNEFHEKLNEIPVCGNEQLEDKRKHIALAIERPIRRIKSHQLNLH